MVLYKILRQKISPKIALTNIDTPNNLPTWENTATTLLNSLFPDDLTAPGLLRPYFHTLPLSTADTSSRRWTADEALHALKTTPKNKVPGPCRIQASMILTLIECLAFIDMFQHLVNACLTFGQFPTIWKMATVSALLKASHKDSQDPYTLPAQCLLPV